MANRRRWNIGVLLLLIIFVYVLVQFYLSTGRIRGLVTPLEASEEDHARLQIALISQELDNPFWRSVEQGALEAAGQYHMELQYTGPFRIDAEEQMKLLEKAIASKMDGIILQGIGNEQNRSLIEKANKLGIPVIAVDTDEPGSKRLAYVGTNNTYAGQEMGRLIAVENKDPVGMIGVLVGSKDAANQRLRLEGFQSVIETYSGLSIAEVSASNISRLQAAQQAEQMLKEHPEIKYMVGFSSLDGIGMAEAVARIKPGGVKIYAFDDLEDTLAAIKNKQIVSSIVQQPSQMGYKAVSILNDYFQGRTVTPQQYTPISVLTDKEVSAR
ncbi:ribose transport system substrate-binding protein [Paenibacillus catalpae]|uniref:Ribose transport system substrate-binding protein n=1 Tax=Paenibacillus catalpae TaxID=1045775 RepID=A0A1I2ANY0_9BACL|nr:substrate-binding domain-containing protein [Paenibacillus catalpae]SFE45417.1 ribose transport system substrate-binding protein [Paenibacillus catalpae]